MHYYADDDMENPDGKSGLCGGKKMVAGHVSVGERVFPSQDIMKR